MTLQVEYSCVIQDAVTKDREDETVNMLYGMIKTAGREMEIKTTELKEWYYWYYKKCKRKKREV
jgi:hypothetical protein